MKPPEEIKSLVKERYGSIAKESSVCCSDDCCTEKTQEAAAQRSVKKAASCCGPACCPDGTAIVAGSYEKLEGYNPDADLRLGCGLPTEHAGIMPGDTVVDLGSGAGNDVFIARAIAGDTGKVIGVDMTPEMIARATRNAARLGFGNVSFILGEIENLPIADSIADVVVSNCVLNLVPDKKKAFSETFRILKPEGHFCISDIVTDGRLPEKVQHAAELLVGCIGGALEKKTIPENHSKRWIQEYPNQRGKKNWFTR